MPSFTAREAPTDESQEPQLLRAIRGSAFGLTAQGRGTIGSGVALASAAATRAAAPPVGQVEPISENRLEMQAVSGGQLARVVPTTLTVTRGTTPPRHASTRHGIRH